MYSANVHASASCGIVGVSPSSEIAFDVAVGSKSAHSTEPGT